MIFRSSVLLSSLISALALFVAVPSSHAFEGCNAKPTSAQVVNVKHMGAKGDGKENDTGTIQKAINEIAGTGGTVYVPNGVYMVRATGKGRLRLRSKMTLKLADGAVLKVIPNRARSYSVLKIGKATDVNVIGGTLLGDRGEHDGKAGEWGMGIRIGPEVKRVSIVGVTAEEMWGDGFYVEGATDVAFCSVVATHNRRQGLSIVEANRLLVTDSVFEQTRGTRPSAGIDIEPDRPEQKVVNVRIEHSRFINNAGGGVMIAGKRGYTADVEIVRNVFEEGRPILIENAPHVRSTEICDNRHIGQVAPPQEGLNAFAETVEVVSLQADCRSGRDMRFEMNRGNTKKKKKKPAN
ncbi:right-handed parallel beta-helix repeat-containing protein [Methyloceanibacter superfactus]|uniref:right-handed parallel beta-helix repeat-containing protein n=1 Tax=Methyloceanibacter superfactus TaxID=1774969 RepID=UPI0009F16F40|nr:right-handed parallel beta-helix repeat-containing protein [Methyloceanibacter superfactus]